MPDFFSPPKDLVGWIGLIAGILAIGQSITPFFVGPMSSSLQPSFATAGGLFIGFLFVSAIRSKIQAWTKRKALGWGVVSGIFLFLLYVFIVFVSALSNAEIAGFFDWTTTIHSLIVRIYDILPRIFIIIYLACGFFIYIASALLRIWAKT